MTQDPNPFAPRPGEPPPGYGQPPAGYGQAPPGYGYVQGQGFGPSGRVRSTGLSILLFFVTFGIYGFVWYYSVHQEMKNHSGTGLGGGIALVIYFFFGVASPFLTSSEVGGLYQRAGRPAPVSALTGLWVMPGIFLLVLPVVWFVRTNGALNAYWRSVGATG